MAYYALNVPFYILSANLGNHLFKLSVFTLFSKYIMLYNGNHYTVLVTRFSVVKGLGKQASALGKNLKSK